tara:strand:+ start:200 stop:493 length:294 start_codon:yes stop_codon:yes gene_type:complete
LARLIIKLKQGEMKMNESHRYCESCYENILNSGKEIDLVFDQADLNESRIKQGETRWFIEPTSNDMKVGVAYDSNDDEVLYYCKDCFPTMQKEGTLF